jgi:hypothetical protein
MGYIAWLRPGYVPLMERWLSVPRPPRSTFSVFPFREGPRVRIPLPPVGSPSLSRSCFRGSGTPAFVLEIERRRKRHHLPKRRRYSPSECVGTRTEKITGKPDLKHVSTSYAERANLTMRMAMRRFTRLTNAFSRKFENHAHMVALYALWYNFVRIHKTLRTSPAMAAGIESRLWSTEDVVALIDEHAERTAPRLADRLVG